MGEYNSRNSDQPRSLDILSATRRLFLTSGGVLGTAMALADEATETTRLGSCKARGRNDRPTGLRTELLWKEYNGRSDQHTS